MTFFHGTSDERADAILAGGFDLDAPRTSDPGDMGWGVYLTDELSRARAHGARVLKVTLDTARFALVANPYFCVGFKDIEPVTAAEKLLHSLAFDGDQMVTVNGSREDREAAAKAIRQAFLDAGWDGIVTSPRPGKQTRGDVEVVVFNERAIVRVENASL